jgi:hypothetical protein
MPDDVNFVACNTTGSGKLKKLKKLGTLLLELGSGKLKKKYASPTATKDQKISAKIPSTSDTTVKLSLVAHEL